MHGKSTLCMKKCAQKKSATEKRSFGGLFSREGLPHFVQVGLCFRINGPDGMLQDPAPHDVPDHVRGTVCLHPQRAGVRGRHPVPCGAKSAPW